ncbi:MAG: hypothetical protein HKN47_07930 [Pirellulaceae bacterium]|nr:hypothetical protein [Pirellulaceae bacterium]
MTTPHLQPDSTEPGQLLIDLERRQDEVLAQLDELDAKVTAVLKSLGATMDDEDDNEEITPAKAA